VQEFANPSGRPPAFASSLFHQEALPVGGDPARGTGHGLIEGMMLRWCQARSIHVLIGSVVPKPVLARLEAADDRVP